MTINADFRNARVITPTTTYDGVRFVFRRGRIAIWTFNLMEMTADRVAFWTDATFAKRRSARDPHTATLSTGEVFNILPLAGRVGCCGSPYPMRGYSLDQLVDPAFTHIESKE